MPRTWLEPTLASVVIFGFGSTALGLLGLLSRSSRRGVLPGWTVWLALLSGAGVALGMAGLKLEQHYWLPLLGLVALGSLFALLRWQGWGRLAAGLTGLVGRPSVQWTLLTLLGPTLILGYSWSLQEKVDPYTMPDLQEGRSFKIDEKPVGQAATDAGRPIPLFAASPGTEPEWTGQTDVAYLKDHDMLLTAIRTGDPSLETNCHGWVFTGGQNWVRTRKVEAILEDNGYHLVSQPQPGDLAVFRDDQGKVGHTGIVRVLNPDGTVLLESKWGRMGRFLHLATRHPYQSLTCTYYHSPRRGHLLHGLAEKAPAGNGDI